MAARVPKLQRNLRENSIEAFILGLELINKLSVKYRLEAFAFLFCNAWELLLKAKLLLDGVRIFYRKRPGEPRKSLSLDDCLRRVYTAPQDPVRLNIETVTELRNQATHLAIPFVPPDVMAVFQAGVLNYTAKLREWFDIDLSSRIPLGMMALVYDIDPSTLSLAGPAIRRAITADALRWVREFQQGIRAQADKLTTGRSSFYIPVNLKLAIVKDPKKADIVLGSTKTGGEKAILVEVPKDPNRTHPYRQKEVIEELNKTLPPETTANSFDILVIRRLYQVDSKHQWVYKPKFASNQYSQAFVDWLAGRAKKDPNFFEKARAKYKAGQQGG